MDNLSHSVAGLAVGELLHRTLAPESDAAGQSVRRHMLLVTAWAACNLPDLDLLLTPLLPAPLGYLLHHRGHTHTLLYAIPQALALLAAIWLLWPNARALLRASSHARRGIVAAAGLGLLLHLAMDYLNVYGVHLCKGKVEMSAFSKVEMSAFFVSFRRFRPAFGRISSSLL